MINNVYFYVFFFFYISRMKNVAAESVSREPVAEPAHKSFYLFIYFCLVK